MPGNQYEIVPLTNDEQDWLMTIYQTRLKNLRVAFVGYMLIFSTAAFFLGLGIQIYFKNQPYSEQVWLINQKFFLWVLTPLIAGLLSSYVCVMSFLSDILPYKKDVASGIKQNVPYIVKTKGYSAVTDEYMITFEGMDRAYDVDEETYLSAEEGGTVVMGRAEYSGYIFSSQNSFTPFVSY